jgi:hypothetical protein
VREAKPALQPPQSQRNLFLKRIAKHAVVGFTPLQLVFLSQD